MEAYKNVDEYIANFPTETQELLEKVRGVIREVAPEAVETISYGIPTFKLNGKNLVHFAAYEHHLGFYPGPVGIETFKDRLNGYETSKGTIKFPLDRPIDYELIKDITAAGATRITG